MQAAIVEAVEDAGYGTRLLRDRSDRNRVQFRVEGMLCSSCSGKVRAPVAGQMSGELRVLLVINLTCVCVCHCEQQTQESRAVAVPIVE